MSNCFIEEYQKKKFAKELSIKTKNNQIEKDLKNLCLKLIITIYILLEKQKKPIPKKWNEFLFTAIKMYYPSSYAKWVRSEIFHRTSQHTAPV